VGREEKIFICIQLGDYFFSIVIINQESSVIPKKSMHKFVPSLNSCIKCISQVWSEFYPTQYFAEQFSQWFFFGCEQKTFSFFVVFEFFTCNAM